MIFGLDIGQLAAFGFASFFLAIVPGPSLLYVLMRVISDGRLAGMASLAGVALGNLCGALASALGLALLFSAFPSVFLATKLIGAGYLLYLGITALRANTNVSARENPGRKPTHKIFLEALIVAATNPKTILFFAAFLPQFITTVGSVREQTIFLGMLFVLIAASVDIFFVLTAATLLPVFTRGTFGKIGCYLPGASYCLLAVYCAFGH